MMGHYLVRRLLGAAVTLLFISFTIFALLDLAPGDPTANLPESVPQTVREQVRVALGLNDPFLVRYARWSYQFLVVEPLNAVEVVTGRSLGGEALGTGAGGEATQRLRLTSWTSRGKPVVDIIVERLPQTLWVVGGAYVVAFAIALPLGVYAAYRRHSWFDRITSVVTVLGYSLPTFFTGVLVIQFFAVRLGWFPTLYNTTLRVTDLASLGEQLRQMALPIAVLAFFQLAVTSRFVRAAVTENLRLDYVRTARAKGLGERLTVTRHVLRNSLIPVVTLLALGIPGIFGGAIVTEQIFAVNGIGQLLITAIQSNDVPVVQTCLMLFAILVVVFNLVADLIYGLLDPRIRSGWTTPP